MQGLRRYRHVLHANEKSTRSRLLLVALQRQCRLRRAAPCLLDFLQELQDRDFVAAQCRRGLPLPLLRWRVDRRGWARNEALQIGMHQRRVNVVFAANRSRISQALRNGIDCTIDVALCFALRGRRTHLAQFHASQHCPAPGTEVFRRDIATAYFTQISVHVVRRDRFPFSGADEVLEQFLARQILAALHDARDTPVGNGNRMLHAAFSPETETQFRSVDLHMLHTQSCQSVGTVFARVFVVAHADQRLVQQLHYRGEYLAPAQLGAAQITFRTLANGGQHFAQLEHVAKLRLVASIAITRMVAVLLPAPGIARRSLDVAFRVRADPYVGPRRRNNQAVDAAALLRINDPLAAGLEENPTPAGTPAADAGHAVGDIVQPGAAGRL